MKPNPNPKDTPGFFDCHGVEVRRNLIVRCVGDDESVGRVTSVKEIRKGIAVVTVKQRGQEDFGAGLEDRYYRASPDQLEVLA